MKSNNEFIGLEFTYHEEAFEYPALALVELATILKLNCVLCGRNIATKVSESKKDHVIEIANENGFELRTTLEDS
ncbi:hypothetical protein HN512_02225 [Candidatus Peregrinibacteria bacterium]|jgi:hypothetical protein|nr:hypothetical protein [Candidatus Peregrinibacteria bacterium]MBT3598630.1 hypothetical protein [Candidatus Peregrinibacteria bacterium]MBT4367251.1 hypothetical protein [Candidatus Peregrinibacteria bacterium]MBT4585729.1 hypothetical protein [Candidatus Peregrinibacteria bacterium]MBT6730971.1 hypothetical protein [Candidatus Peregrinibacteria bacterium]